MILTETVFGTNIPLNKNPPTPDIIYIKNTLSHLQSEHNNNRHGFIMVLLLPYPSLYSAPNVELTQQHYD